MLEQGTVIQGRFEIVRRLGGGSQGELFRARDRHTDMEVAVKIQNPKMFDLTTDYKRDAKSLRKEFRRTQSLSGVPGIPRAYWYGDHCGRQCMAMELIQGVTLSTFLRENRPLRAFVAASVLGQLCEILERVHDSQWVHRDITPANVMIQSADGRVRLIDVGIADKIGKPGIRCGSVGYAAPEQYIDDEPVAPTADVFSLGCILFEMSAMQLPYSGGRPEPSVPPFPRGLPGSMGQELRTLGLSMVALDPAARPASAVEVLRAIEPMLPPRHSAKHSKAPDPDPTTYYRL